jgi:hypothetical protein
MHYIYIFIYVNRIYSLRKFGMLIKPEQQLSEPLKFVFHLTKFRCKMLKENKVYITIHIYI